MVSVEQNTRLTSRFSLPEIKSSVLQLLGKNKAPGPDGYTIEFLISFWDHFKDNYLALFNEFYENGRFNACVKENFICLFKKKEDAVRVKDFRPISLTTLIYKLVAKVLTERLKKVMPSIIAPSQSGFLEGRQILGPIFIANEAVEDYRIRKKKGWIVKLDLEKAFDRVDWAFLEEVMRKKNFVERWILWIMGCIKNPKYSVFFH